MIDFSYEDEAIPITEAEKMGKLYRMLQQIDENRKFRKTIDKRQVVLEQCIARKQKELKNADSAK